MSSMFSNCSNLRTIAVCSWNTDNVSSCSNIFENCTNLKGGKGTAFDTSHINDKTYARVDGGTSAPGYFTGKPVFTGRSLVLSGEIGVIFTLEVPNNFAAADASVELKVGNKPIEPLDFSKLEQIEGTNKYRVTCHVSSLEMAEDVVATLKDWSGESTLGSVTAHTSVESYADYVYSHNVSGDKGVGLAQAINDYGYHTQLWLAQEHGFTLGDGEGDAYAKMKGASLPTGSR
jgi:hypothetical protein